MAKIYTRKYLMRYSVKNFDVKERYSEMIKSLDKILESVESISRNINVKAIEDALIDVKDKFGSNVFTLLY